MERLTNPFFFAVKTLFHSSPLIVSHYGVTNFPRDSTLLKWNNWTERPESAPPTTFPSKLNKFLFWLLSNKLFIGTGMDEHGDRSHQWWLIMVVPRPPGILLLLLSCYRPTERIWLRWRNIVCPLPWNALKPVVGFPHFTVIIEGNLLAQVVFSPLFCGNPSCCRSAKGGENLC